ncbi:MAG TPA: diacylglycerol kinase family protein [Parafilimonas sp.]|jgi:diacylglycerol kinase|nr:diacylglycerol kinase family protein [Parafilimonas sp.]
MQTDLNAGPAQSFVAAVANAFHGIIDFFRLERNGRIQGLITIIVLLASAVLRLTSIEWIVVLLCICAVLGLEMVNSALEHLCNLVQRDFHPLVKKIKDVSAGAVLVASIISVVIGLIIFIPKIFALV